MSAVLAQFKKKVTAWVVGSGNVIFIHLVRSLALCQKCVGCTSHLNVSKTSLCHKRSPVIHALPCAHTHTYTPTHTFNCTILLQILKDSWRILSLLLCVVFTPQSQTWLSFWESRPAEKLEKQRWKYCRFHPFKGFFNVENTADIFYYGLVHAQTCTVCE